MSGGLGGRGGTWSLVSEGLDCLGFFGWGLYWRLEVAALDCVVIKVTLVAFRYVLVACILSVQSMTNQGTP